MQLPAARSDTAPIMSMLPGFVPMPTCTLRINACSKPSSSTHKSPQRRGRRPVAPPDARPVTSLNIGESLVGTVDRIGGADSAWIDINCATLTGKLIHARLRLLSGTRKGPRQVPAEGRTLPVRVSRLNVPAARVEVVPAWEREPPKPPVAVHRLEDLTVGQRLPGIVLGLVKAGAVIDVRVSRPGRRDARKQCTGLLRRKHFPNTWASGADTIVTDAAERVLQVGDTLDVYVREPSVKSATLFLDASPVTTEQIEAERNAWRINMKRRYRRKAVSTLSMGDVRTGVVRRVQKYGCFVDVGVKSDGLIHFSDMGEHSGTWKTTVPEGARVVVEVSGMKEEKMNLRLVKLADDDLSADEDDENFAMRRFSPSAVKQSPDAKVEVEESDEDTDDEDDSNEQGDGEEEYSSLEDKFTDEYFEDKYDIY